MENPFSDDDFDRILREERSSSRSDGWKQLDATAGAEVWRKIVPDCNIHLVKAFLDLPGVHADEALELLYDLDVRKNYDKLFLQYETLEDFQDYRITYALVKFPPGTWDRDIVQYNTKRSRDGEHIILYKNAQHSSRPPISSYVRAETIFSGSIIRPQPNDPDSSTLTVFLQTDVKGWIPSSIINFITGQSPGPWRQSLLDYHQQRKQKQKKSTSSDNQ